MIPNAFTVDVEEWFHILDTEGAAGPEGWDHLESRVERETDLLLELLQERGVRATFFVLGWVAERNTGLVRRIADQGHELATHGHAHQLAYRLGLDRFGDDVRRARASLEDAAGQPVHGFRAAGFSLTRETPWAFDILSEQGFRYDSSIFPCTRAHGGLPVRRVRPFRISGPTGRSLWEFPIPPVRVGPLALAFAGGGYLRFWPLWFLRWAERSLHRRRIPVTYYIHPREMDPSQPRMRLPLLRRFKYYVNLASTPAKLTALLHDDAVSRYRTLGELAEDLDRNGGLSIDPPLRLVG